MLRAPLAGNAMNWLDYVLLGTLAVSAAVGLKLGLIKAMLVAVAVYVGWLVAGRLSGGIGEFLSGLVSMDGDVGELLSKTVQNETILTVATYVVIIAAFLLIARIVSKLAFVLKLATLGLSSVVDRGGGLVLGFLIGVALTSTLVVGLAALTYGTEYDEALSSVPSSAVDLGRVDRVMDTFEGTLVGSPVVSVHLDVFDALPGDALGFVPPTFTRAVDILESEVELAERVSP